MLDRPADVVPLFPYPLHHFEVMGVYFLTKDNALITSDYYQGELDHVTVPVGRIVSKAIRLSAGKVAFVHNHPSGDTELSDDDRRTAHILLMRLFPHGILMAGYFAVHGDRHSGWDGYV
jgi:DNA repair protein RadC